MTSLFSRKALIFLGLLALLSSGTFARDADSEPIDLYKMSLEELLNVKVIGSRRVVSSTHDVLAPVDIISINELRSQGSTDMVDLFRTTIPSFNVGSHPLSGTSTTVRPPSLRGLSPDHVLVLINGKRRHRGADIPTFSGGISDGSQGPDYSTLPAIAFKQVQVLRDGAAAQYGADAVAGVINFILNDDPEGGFIEGKWGSTYKGDGDTYQVAGTYGFSLGGSGFVRFSGEFRESDATDRSVMRADVVELLENGNNHLKDPAQTYGSPNIDDDLKSFFNMEVDTWENNKLYAFGSYSKRLTNGGLFFRNPNGRFGVFTDDDDGGNFLIGDMTPNDGRNCEGGIDFGGTGAVNDPIAVDAPDADARLAKVFAQANCYSALEAFPGGYTPQLGSKVKDYSGTIGMRGELDNRIRYDLSMSSGKHSIKFDVSNVLNPSLGFNSETVFGNVGRRIQREKNVNIDLAYPLHIPGLASGINLAVGFEWREEKFQVVEGIPSSYEAGVLAPQGFLVGEEAYPGYTPVMAGIFKRKNYAFYLDVEGELTTDFVMGAAVRYEDFDGIGTEAIFKIAGLYHLTEKLSFRANYSTGFHAPTPGQQNFSALSTELDSEGNLLETGIIPSTSPIATTVGGKQIESEASKSTAFGMIYGNDLFQFTMDCFRIEVKDRITQSSSFTLTNEQKEELIKEGFIGAAGISTFRFFVNDFESVTQGVDLVAKRELNLTDNGKSNIRLYLNWTKTEVTSYDPTDEQETLSTTRVIQLEENHPEYRAHLTLNHSQDKWRILARVNYFGSFTELHVNSGSLRVNADSQTTIDVEAGYKLTDRVEIALGADNIFNSTPDDNPWDFIVGSKYPTTAPGGINGSFYYGKLSYSF